MRSPNSSRHDPPQPYGYTTIRKHPCIDEVLTFGLPVGQILGDVQVFQVVVYGPLILLQQSVGVSEAVTRLRLHHLVSQLL